MRAGLHDTKTAIPKFAMNMRALAQRLKMIRYMFLRLAPTSWSYKV